MAWFKVDDGLWSDPEMMGLSDGALALWLKAGTYCAGKLLDGFLPQEALKLLQTRKRYVAELVDKGVWVWQPAGSELAARWQSAGGWLAIRWQANALSREAVLAKRHETNQRVRAHRNAVSKRVSNASPDPGPARPVPIPDPVPEVEAEDACARAVEVERPAAPAAAASEARCEVVELRPPSMPVPRAPAPLAPAARASRLLFEILATHFDPTGSYANALRILGGGSDEEWARARPVLQEQVCKPGIRRILRPDHIEKFWASHYSQGDAPGPHEETKRPGLTKVATDAEYLAAANSTEALPWQ